MQFLLLLAAIGSTSAAVTCDDCEAYSAGLVSHLTSKASLAEQEAGLIQSICPEHPDPAFCQEGVNKWWSDMAGCLYPHFITDNVCQRLGLCKEWTCEDCIGTMAKTSTFMAQEETATMAVSLLQGECFCGQPAHTEGCGPFISKFIPQAMKVVSDVLSSTTPHMCGDMLGMC